MQGPKRDGGGGSGSPLKNHKNIGFLSKTGPEPLEIYKAAKPAFNVKLAKRHLNDILLGAVDGPL